MIYPIGTPNDSPRILHYTFSHWGFHSLRSIWTFPAPPDTLDFVPRRKQDRPEPSSIDGRRKTLRVGPQSPVVLPVGQIDRVLDMVGIARLPGGKLAQHPEILRHVVELGLRALELEVEQHGAATVQPYFDLEGREWNRAPRKSPTQRELLARWATLRPGDGKVKVGV